MIQDHFKQLWGDQKGEGDFSSVYLILVFAIAALLLLFLIKPMFRESQPLVKQVPGTAPLAGK